MDQQQGAAQGAAKLKNEGGATDGCSQGAGSPGLPAVLVLPGLAKGPSLADTEPLKAALSAALADMPQWVREAVAPCALEFVSAQGPWRFEASLLPHAHCDVAVDVVGLRQRAIKLIQDRGPQPSQPAALLADAPGPVTLEQVRALLQEHEQQLLQRLASAGMLRQG